MEIANLAQEADLFDIFMERCRGFYPGVMEVVDRMLPTYPRHARRRAEEMAELAETMAALGLRPEMVQAARNVTQAIAEAKLHDIQGASWTSDQVLKALHAGDELREKEERKS